MANIIKLKRGTNAPTARQYNVYVYDSSTWDVDKKTLYVYDSDTGLYHLTIDTIYNSEKTYYTLSGALFPYELGYRTGLGGGRIYLNDGGTITQIGRKIFVQGTEPTSAQSMEGDLWVDTSSL